MTSAGVPAPDIIRLAGRVVDGRIFQAEGDYDAAAASFRDAVAIQDGLPYMEPPYWYYPVRQSLGAVLLQATGRRRRKHVPRVVAPASAQRLGALRP